jgi:hypothetical protein
VRSHSRIFAAVACILYYEVPLTHSSSRCKNLFHSAAKGTSVKGTRTDLVCGGKENSKAIAFPFRGNCPYQ